MDPDRLVAESVERRSERLAAVARERGQDLDGPFLGAGVAREVELRPVARRDDDRFAAEPLGDRAGAIEVERNPLAQLDRRTVVRDADQRQHDATPTRGDIRWFCMCGGTFLGGTSISAPLLQPSSA